MKEGIYLNKDDAESFLKDLEELKEIHNYKNAYLRWEEDENEDSGLSVICAAGGEGIWLKLGFNDLHRSMFKITPHNIKSNSECLFFVECLAKYLKYSEIESPYIKTEVLDIVEKKSFCILKMKKKFTKYTVLINLVIHLFYLLNLKWKNF